MKWSDRPQGLQPSVGSRCKFHVIYLQIFQAEWTLCRNFYNESNVNYILIFLKKNIFFFFFFFFKKFLLKKKKKKTVLVSW